MAIEALSPEEWEEIQVLDATAACDFAGSRETEQVGRSKQAVCAVGWDASGRFYVLHAWGLQTTSERLIEEVCEVQLRHDPSSFGFEVAATQGMTAELIVDRAKDRKLHIPMVPLDPSKAFPRLSKFRRVESILAPLVNRGRLVLGPGQHELMTALGETREKNVPDEVDALAWAVWLAPPRVSEREANVHLDSREQLEYFHKLRGTDPRDVERRVKHLQSKGYFQRRKRHGE